VSAVAALARERALPEPLVVVTTPAHLGRVLLLSRREHLSVIPAAAAELRYDAGLDGWRQWWPRTSALIGSESAMYEYLALLHARLGGIARGGAAVNRKRAA
jgi:hypothetical protein